MSIHNDDTIKVRADERFDENRLAVYLHGQLPGSKTNFPYASLAAGSESHLFA